MDINYKQFIVNSNLAYSYLAFSKDHQDLTIINSTFVIINNTTDSQDLVAIIPSSFIITIIKPSYSYIADLLVRPYNQDFVQSLDQDTMIAFIVTVKDQRVRLIIALAQIMKPFITNQEFKSMEEAIYSDIINYIIIGLTIVVTIDSIIIAKSTITIIAIATPIINTKQTTITKQLISLSLNFP